MRKSLMKLAAAAVFAWAAIAVGGESVRAWDCGTAIEACNNAGCQFSWSPDYEGQYCYYGICYYTCTCTPNPTSWGSCEQ